MLRAITNNFASNFQNFLENMKNGGSLACFHGLKSMELKYNVQTVSLIARRLSGGKVPL